MKYIFLTTLGIMMSVLFINSAHAEMIKRDIVYRTSGDDVKMIGRIYYKKQKKSLRPGVLIFHEWTGRNKYAEKRARQLAEMGYIAFAVDMYGDGMRTSDPKQAAEWSSAVKGDRALMQARANAALKAMLSTTCEGNKITDPDQVSAIGYCFGGTCALELARSGADVDGIVSFHGGLDNPSPELNKEIKPEILVLHGADDPYVPAEEVDSFKAEMEAAKVKMTFIAYPDAVHAFTNPDSGDDKSRGAAYNEDADKKSWEEMKLFFNRLFGK